MNIDLSKYDISQMTYQQLQDLYDETANLLTRIVRQMHALDDEEKLEEHQS